MISSGTRTRLPLSSYLQRRFDDHSFGGFAAGGPHPQSTQLLGHSHEEENRMLKWHPGTTTVLAVLALILVAALLAGFSEWEPTNFNW